MKILNIGSFNIDNVYQVEKLVVPGETIFSKKYQVFAGGKGLNQSIAIVKAGAKGVYHAGDIGMNGEFLLYTLLEHGINTDFVRRSNQKTGHAVIQVADNGEHTIISHGGSNQYIDIDFIDEIISHFGKNDLLILQNEISNVEYIINKAWEKEMRIIFNPAPANKNILKYDLRKIDTLIVNKSELYECTQKNEVEEAIRILKKKEINILLTLGKKGGIYYGKNKEEYKYKSYEVKEVDTTGIGDAFVGYFVAGLSKEEQIPCILEESSRAAALTATKIGASVSIPLLEEVQKFGQ